MARARVVHEIKYDRHGPYLRLQPPPRKASHAFRIARQISRKMTDPMVAVIRLPQKSGTTSKRSFSNRNPPTTEPTTHTPRLYSRPPRPPRIWVASHPATRPMMIQAMTPIVL